MRIRVWQIIKDLKEDPAFVLERCKELNLRASGRFSILTQREAEFIREAVVRYRRDEQEKARASRKIRFAPGMSPEELEKKKKEEEQRKKRVASSRPSSTRYTTSSTQAPPSPQQPAPARTAKPDARDSRKKGKDDRKSSRDVKKDRFSRSSRSRGRQDSNRPEFSGSATLPGLHRLSRGSKRRGRKQQPVMPTGKAEVQVPCTLRDLSQYLGVKANDIIFKFMKAGKMVTLNSLLDEEAVEMLALEYDREIVIKKEKAADELFQELEANAIENADGKGEKRAPVVTFLGHVDHGKTSLLDRIRKSSVQTGEAGGITQHIGAYRLDREEEDVHITFLDTPGHEAFTQLRARGAQLTDVAVLVVAADDGIMPQTEEAISHIKAAGVSIVVAINKIDKPDADVMRVKQQLMNFDLVPEEWGGSTVCCEVSAITGDGLDNLLEMIMLEAEMAELSAHADGSARGTVIESRVDVKLGSLATVLVEDGTLHKGDILVVGSNYSRVRNLRDWNNKTMKSAGPSYPVEIWGLSGLPNPGDKFIVVDSLDKAKKIASERAEKDREESLQSRSGLTLQQFLLGAKDESKDLPIIIKSDVIGSKEVLEASLEKVSSSKAKVNVIHSAVGGVNEADVQLADASDAIIIGFNVVPDAKTKALADQRKIEIRFYNVIYDLIDDIRKALQGLLEPIKNEITTARVEVKAVFKAGKIGVVAGCIVRSGTVTRSQKIRLIRNNVVIQSCQIDSLRRFKEDVKEVREGYECGIKLQGYDDIKVGDFLETFKIELTYPELED